MSRAFVKDDAASEPILVPPRAHLPPGIPNYVTPRGLALLKSELAELTDEREQLESGQANAAQMASLQGRMDELGDRITSAKVVDPADAPRDEVAFGASVRVQMLGGKLAGQERRLTIVGVDEAALEEGRVAFTAPIAQALLGHRVGDEVYLQTAQQQALKIMAIEYD